jgi:hypothetical protein
MKTKTETEGKLEEWAQALRLKQRESGRMRAATIEHELLTEGRTSTEKLNLVEAPQ